MGLTVEYEGFAQAIAKYGQPHEHGHSVCDCRCNRSMYLGLLQNTIGIPEQAPDDGAGEQGCDRQRVSGILLILFGQQAPALYNSSSIE